MMILEKDIVDMTDKELEDLLDNYRMTTILLAILNQLQIIRKGTR